MVTRVISKSMQFVMINARLLGHIDIVSTIYGASYEF